MAHAPAVSPPIFSLMERQADDSQLLLIGEHDTAVEMKVLPREEASGRRAEIGDEANQISRRSEVLDDLLREDRIDYFLGQTSSC